MNCSIHNTINIKVYVLGWYIKKNDRADKKNSLSIIVSLWVPMLLEHKVK